MVCRRKSGQHFREAVCPGFAVSPDLAIKASAISPIRAHSNGVEKPQKKRNTPSHLNYADHRGRRCPVLRTYFVRCLRSCWLPWQEPLLLGRSTTQLSPINVVTTPLQCSYLSRWPTGVTLLRNTGSASCTSTAR